jgi:hypothetical protein
MYNDNVQIGCITLFYIRELHAQHYYYYFLFYQ